MKLRTITLLTFVCGITGIIFFLVQRNLLIIHLTFTPSHLAQNILSSQESLPRSLKIYYLKNEKWHHDQAAIIWDEKNPSLNLKQLVNQWLKVLHDEHLAPAHLALKSAAISSPGSEAYLNFDNSLFDLEWSIMKKWQLLESLFKTIHQANFHISTISLLLHNKPMDDDHLDVSVPLPIQGRLQITL